MSAVLIPRADTGSTPVSSIGHLAWENRSIGTPDASFDGRSYNNSVETEQVGHTSLCDASNKMRSWLSDFGGTGARKPCCSQYFQAP